MKGATIFFLFVSIPAMTFSQQTTTLQNVLSKIMGAQASLKSVQYSVTRTDTLVTGDIRSMKGKVIISKDNADTILGFRFWSKKDSENSEKIYDGHSCYETDIKSKTYRMGNGRGFLQSMLYGGGGHLVMPDLVHLDTAENNGILLKEGNGKYEITISYPDLTEYNVTERKKIVTIDKKIMLPVEVRQHQETDRRAQDLYFHITAIITSPNDIYNFSAPPFLKQYTFVPSGDSEIKSKLAKGMVAPGFALKSFDGKMISSEDFKGKVVLLDFWEVWCGPCIESMPKVAELYKRYHGKGLEVLGITNDLKQLSISRAFAKRKNIEFPLLIGNELIKRNYDVLGVPFYIVIDKEGIIHMVSLGFTSELEKVLENIMR